MTSGKTNRNRLEEIAHNLERSRLQREGALDRAPRERDRSLAGKARIRARKAAQRAAKGSVLRRG